MDVTKQEATAHLVNNLEIEGKKAQKSQGYWDGIAFEDLQDSYIKKGRMVRLRLPVAKVDCVLHDDHIKTERHVHTLDGVVKVWNIYPTKGKSWEDGNNLYVDKENEVQTDLAHDWSVAGMVLGVTYEGNKLHSVLVKLHFGVGKALRIPAERIVGLLYGSSYILSREYAKTEKGKELKEKLGSFVDVALKGIRIPKKVTIGGIGTGTAQNGVAEGITVSDFPVKALHSRANGIVLGVHAKVNIHKKERITIGVTYIEGVIRINGEEIGVKLCVDNEMCNVTGDTDEFDFIHEVYVKGLTEDENLLVEDVMRNEFTITRGEIVKIGKSFKSGGLVKFFSDSYLETSFGKHDKETTRQNPMNPKSVYVR
ncbi:hypothetical protein [Bacillus thuringiensis]|uniref:hypothetical protein n=1 Tax=Bacillus thuringiensis TaxID=1428 RepID=UPI000BFDA91C|nr:hypothetical protein [Bacillus thuringiensis]PGT89990.1 hypothetical protein COD17_09580 [Bacillus thuringiensis]